MEKEFIPYEQALALKKLGFEYIATIFAYDDAKELYTRSGIPHDFNIRGLLSAPSFSQAFRWFREKYKLVCIIFNDDGDIEHGNLRYNWEIRVITYSFKNMKNEKNACLSNYSYKTYEEAELECLKKLIEIVKEK